MLKYALRRIIFYKRFVALFDRLDRDFDGSSEAASRFPGRGVDPSPALSLSFSTEDIQNNGGLVLVASCASSIQEVAQMFFSKFRGKLRQFLEVAATYPDFEVQLILGHKPRICNILGPTGTEQVARVAHFSIEILLHSFKQPPAGQPDPDVRTPFYVALLELVAIVFGRYHVGRTFVVPFIHDDLKFGERKIVLNLPNVKQLLEHPMACEQLLEMIDVIRAETLIGGM